MNSLNTSLCEFSSSLVGMYCHMFDYFFTYMRSCHLLNSSHSRSPSIALLSENCIIFHCVDILILYVHVNGNICSKNNICIDFKIY